MGLLAYYQWHWQIIWEDHHLQYLLGGIKLTVMLTATTFCSGLALAFFVAAGRLSRFRLVRWASYVYVEFFRTVPLLLGLLWGSSGVPSPVPGLRLPPVICACPLFT